MRCQAARQKHKLQRFRISLAGDHSCIGLYTCDCNDEMDESCSRISMASRPLKEHHQYPCAMLVLSMLQPKIKSLPKVVGLTALPTISIPTSHCTSTLQPFTSPPATPPPQHHGLPFPSPPPPWCPAAVPRPELLPVAPGPGPRATPGHDAAGTGGGGAHPCGGAQQGLGGHCGGQAAAGAGAGTDFRIGLGNGAMEPLGWSRGLFC